MRYNKAYNWPDDWRISYVTEIKMRDKNFLGDKS